MHLIGLLIFILCILRNMVEFSSTQYAEQEIHRNGCAFNTIKDKYVQAGESGNNERYT